MYIIGIVGRVNKNIDGQSILQTTDAIRRAVMKYEDVVSITLLPTECNKIINIVDGKDVVDKKIDYVLDKCDAFIVPGGTTHYNFDEYIVNYAIKNNKPLLAICLGFQVLCGMYAVNRNKFEMVNKISGHCGKPDSYQHANIIKKDTLLYDVLGKDKLMVNSVHNYGVDFKMNTLCVNAISEDGFIEGVEYPNKDFILGLQWHPEYLMDDDSIKIFDTFINKIKTSHLD